MWTLAVLSALGGASAAVAQVNITLRGSASIAPTDGARGIALSDVADLDPPTTEEAFRLGEIVIAPARGAARITVSDVRGALDAAKVNWGRITLRGTACQVSINAAVAPMATAPVLKPSPARVGLSQATPQSITSDALDSGTLKGVVSARLVDLYNVDPADLRLAFDPSDEQFLSQLVGNRRVDVQPASTGNSVRTPVNIYIYEGDRLVGTRLVSVQALVNRTVVTARASIARGQAISLDLVEVVEQWITPNAKPPVSPTDALGQIAARGINAGAILTTADITSPIVCKRGDLVWVHVLSGPVTVKAKCRAQGQARDGELVQLKLEGSDRLFMARMSGPGRAVMVADGTGGGTDDGAGDVGGAPARKPVRISAKSH
jgi:flagella basal body P-ring formation protein FlgA